MATAKKSKRASTAKKAILPEAAKRGLTDAEYNFALELLRNGFNRTQAAIAAGYSRENAAVAGSRLVRRINVRRLIIDKFDEKGLIPENIKIAFAEIAFDADLADFDPYLTGEVDGLSELRATGVNTKFLKSATVTTYLGKDGDVSSVRRKVEITDRQTALTNLGKVYAMFRETLDVNHQGQVDLNPVGLSGDELQQVAKDREGPPGG